MPFGSVKLSFSVNEGVVDSLSVHIPENNWGSKIVYSKGAASMMHGAGPRLLPVTALWAAKSPADTGAKNSVALPGAFLIVGVRSSNLAIANG